MADILQQGAELNLEIVQGATFVLPIAIKDSNNTAVDITGASMKAQIRKKADATTVIVTLNTPDEIVITNASGGLATITIPVSVTEDFPTGRYKWDLFITYASGQTDRMFYGDVLFISNITDPSV